MSDSATMENCDERKWEKKVFNADSFEAANNSESLFS